MKKLPVFLILLLIITLSLYAQETKQEVTQPDPLRFKGEIDNFINYDKKNSFPKDAVLFVGSSSIRMWPTADYFPEFKVINRGFGGSVTGDVNFYYDDIVKKYKPSIIVFYCGDNDIAAGLAVDKVFNDFVNFCTRVGIDLPGTKIFYLPVKPSLARWSMWADMDQVNKKVEEYCNGNEKLSYIDTATPILGDDGKPMSSLFLEDGLHLNKSGYDLWTSVVKPVLMKAIK